MQKKKAYQHQAISTLYNMTLSNGLDPRNAKEVIMTACDISKATFYKIINFPANYYVQEIKEHESNSYKNKVINK